MRKSITASNGFAMPVSTTGVSWLDLAKLARLEISSEDKLYPAEQALTWTTPDALPGRSPNTIGWKAELLGPQTILLRFDQPQTIRRVWLHFRETVRERSQEFALYATTLDGHTHEIVRQQWSFSPRGSTEEQEDYSFNLENVTALTLWIDPDRGRDRYPATLMAFRVQG
jgi:hypothetical protein